MAYSAESSYYLSKGEQKVIKTGCAIRKISPSNKQIVRYKYLSQKNQMLIKGLKTGTSDIIAWCNNGKRLHLHINVLTKSKQMIREQIAKEIEGPELKVKVIGKVIYIEGVISKNKNYKILKNIKMNYKNDILIRAQLSQKLKNNIIQNIYEKSYQNNVSFIECKIVDITFHCEYESLRKKVKILESLKKKYFLQLSYKDFKNEFRQYRGQFYLYQIRLSDQDQMNFPLQEFQAIISQNSIKGKINNNILLNGSLYRFQQVSTPEVVFSLGKNSTIKMGTEIPFELTSREQQKVEWKFAGISIEFKIEGQLDQFSMDFNTELSTPSQDNIITNVKSSSLFLKENKVTPLFHSLVTYHTMKKNHLPYLKYVPLLNLFGGNNISSQKVYLVGFFKFHSEVL